MSQSLPCILPRSCLKMAKKKVVLAYSGGLDTSVMLKWIQEQYNCDVISVTLDVGQGKNFETIEEKAWKLGVLNHYSIDAKEEFAKEYVFQAIKANALYMGTYSVSSSLSRPLIAKKLVEIADKEEAQAVAHGCTGKGNDQVRFDITIKSLNPDLEITFYPFHCFISQEHDPVLISLAVHL